METVLIYHAFPGKPAALAAASGTLDFRLDLQCGLW